MIGEQITPVLVEIEETLLEFEINSDLPPGYPIEGFRASTKIFMSTLMDKMWELQEKENIPMDNRVEMVTKAGKDFRELIKKYTNIDTHDLYK